MSTRKYLTRIGYVILACLVVLACSEKDVFTTELPTLSISTDDGGGSTCKSGYNCRGEQQKVFP